MKDSAFLLSLPWHLLFPFRGPDGVAFARLGPVPCRIEICEALRPSALAFLATEFDNGALGLEEVSLRRGEPALVFRQPRAGLSS